MKKNRKTITFTIFTIIAIILVYGIIAYLTDTDTKVNKFTIGKVDITLSEPSWQALSDLNNNDIPDVAEALEPGDVVAKDPQVNNIEKNSAYVYLKVSIPLGNYTSGNATYNNSELFTLVGINSAKWAELEAARSNDGNNNIYVYYYKTPLAGGSQSNPTSTEPLFTSVKFKEDISDTSSLTTSSSEKQIIVDAYAIQSNNLPSGQSVTNNDMVSQLTTFNSPVHAGILEQTSN